eukprot:Gregarina_sp_Poly_1__1514@NODE_137_length_13137_cov_148_628156_g122_i0_p5_GENE_NODE_137_length_13137_cov_148_628156_g122_i0NODE_137_length_13137_cov_148_628156_g122_i0_p5_ORF_typecomplete_len380_score30_00_NODE_137_length_13137_cov_148_628156_g122_i055996738
MFTPEKLIPKRMNSVPSVASSTVLQPDDDVQTSISPDRRRPESFKPNTQIKKSSAGSEQDSWKWAYADGAIWGRLRASWCRNSKRGVGIKPLHVAVIGNDLGVYGYVELRDFIGDQPPPKSRHRGGFFSGLSRLASRFISMVFVMALGVITGFTFFRPTVIIEADVTSVTLPSKLQISHIGSSLALSGTIHFDLSVSNPSFLPQQLLLYQTSLPNQSATNDDPFNDTDHGGRVLGLLVPFGTTNTSLYQPLGFATPASKWPLVPSQAAVGRISFNLTTRLTLNDFEDGFAAHLSKCVTKEDVGWTYSLLPSNSAPYHNASNMTILELYAQQCQLGFVLMEAAVMHLIYQDITGAVYSQLFRTNPFPVPCEFLNSTGLPT